MTDGIYIERDAFPIILKSLSPGKVVVVYGPRRTGKTTLVSRLADEAGSRAMLASAEDISVREYLACESMFEMKSGRKTPAPPKAWKEAYPD